MPVPNPKPASGSGPGQPASSFPLAANRVGASRDSNLERPERGYSQEPPNQWLIPGAGGLDRNYEQRPFDRTCDAEIGPRR
jgi:hypothetical protein